MKSLLAGCLLLTIFQAQAVIASDYCQPMPKAEKEGDPWYMPESAFTREEANKALKELQSQTNKDWNGADFLSVENRLTMIKGYLFRVYLDGYRKQTGKDDKNLKEEFCRFIREEAIITH